jgi:hypothetical protein
LPDLLRRIAALNAMNGLDITLLVPLSASSATPDDAGDVGLLMPGTDAAPPTVRDTGLITVTRRAGADR